MHPFMLLQKRFIKMKYYFFTIIPVFTREIWVQHGSGFTNTGEYPECNLATVEGIRELEIYLTERAAKLFSLTNVFVNIAFFSPVSD